MAIKITGVGSYIPNLIIPNQSFEKKDFYNEDGTRFNAENKIIIENDNSNWIVKSEITNPTVINEKAIHVKIFH